MAQLDANLFLQQKGPDLSQVGDSFERGIRLGDMMKQRKIEEETRMAKKPLEDQRQALEMQRSQAELVANAALGSKDQASYTNNLNILRQKGIDLTGVPDIYDSKLVDNYGGMALSAKERIENQLNKENMALKREDQSLDRQFKYANMQQNRMDRQDAAAAKAAEAEAALAVPGFTRDGSVKPKPDEVSKLRSAVAIANDMIPSLKRMSELVKNYGSFEYGGTAGQEMASIATDLQLSGKGDELYKLGVLTGPDLTLLRQITANPDSLDSMFTRDKTRQKQIETQINSIVGKLNSRASSLGYQKANASGENQIKKEDMPSKPQTVMQNGHMYKLNPQTGEYE